MSKWSTPRDSMKAKSCHRHQVGSQLIKPLSLYNICANHWMKTPKLWTEPLYSLFHSGLTELPSSNSICPFQHVPLHCEGISGCRLKYQTPATITGLKYQNFCCHNNTVERVKFDPKWSWESGRASMCESRERDKQRDQQLWWTSASSCRPTIHHSIIPISHIFSPLPPPLPQNVDVFAFHWKTTPVTLTWCYYWSSAALQVQIHTHAECFGLVSNLLCHSYETWPLVPQAAAVTHVRHVKLKSFSSWSFSAWCKSLLLCLSSLSVDLPTDKQTDGSWSR